MNNVNTTKAWALGVAMDAMDYEDLIDGQDGFFEFADRVLAYVTEEEEDKGFKPTLVN